MTKNEIREKMKALRRAMRSDDKSRADQRICAKIFAKIQDFFAKNNFEPSRHPIAIYCAAKNEIDLTELARACLAKNFALVAPRWNGTSYDLANVKSLDACDWREGPMKIREPRENDCVAPQAVKVWILPGLAFTREGARLGYGGGWYDRFLAHAADDSLTLGVAYSFQILANLPCEAHDINVSAVLTDE